jgi:hypothetical protein
MSEEPWDRYLGAERSGYRLTIDLNGRIRKLDVGPFIDPDKVIDHVAQVSRQEIALLTKATGGEAIPGDMANAILNVKQHFGGEVIAAEDSRSPATLETIEL